MNQQLFVWRFTPVARRDDPAWQGRPIWTDLRIVAATAGEAILLASRYDQAERGLSNEGPADRQQRRSGLEDPLLYRCDRLHPATSPDMSRGTVVSRGQLLARRDDLQFPTRVVRGLGAAPVTSKAANS
jgi:hypothetical protein